MELLILGSPLVLFIFVLILITVSFQLLKFGLNVMFVMLGAIGVLTIGFVLPVFIVVFMVLCLPMILFFKILF